MKRVILLVLASVLLFAASLFLIPTAANAGGTVTLELWEWGSPAIMEAKNNIVESFQKYNPDIKVKLTELPYPRFHEKLLTAVAAGEEPDISCIEVGDGLGYIMRGMVLNLQPYFNRDKINMDDYHTSLLNQEGRYPDEKGDIYIMSPMFHFMVMPYNRDMFDKGGVGYPSLDWTWADLEDAARRLTKDTDGDGKPDEWGFQFGLYHVATRMYQAGSSLLAPNRAKSNLNTPEGYKVMESVVRLFPYTPGPDAAVMAMKLPSTLTGKVAIGEYHIWTTSQDAWAETSVNWDFGYYTPRMEKGSTRVTMGHPETFIVFNTTKNKEEVWRLVKYYIGEEAQTKYISQTGLIPIHKAGLNAAFDFMKKRHPTRNFEGVARAQTPYIKGWQMFPAWVEGLTPIQENINKARAEKWGSRRLADEAAAAVNRELDKVWKNLNNPWAK
jgi:multiple sugar transport system substrate-binding protein